MNRNPHRDDAVAEFVQSWEQYRYPTRAAEIIGEKHGVSRSAMISALRSQGKWPSARPSQVLELQQRNQELIAENQRLRERLRAEGISEE